MKVLTFLTDGGFSDLFPGEFSAFVDGFSETSSSASTLSSMSDREAVRVSGQPLVG